MKIEVKFNALVSPMNHSKIRPSCLMKLMANSHRSYSTAASTLFITLGFSSSKHHATQRMGISSRSSLPAHLKDGRKSAGPMEPH